MNIIEWIFGILLIGTMYIAVTSCAINMLNFIIGQLDDNGKIKSKLKCIFRAKWVLFTVISLPPVSISVFIICGIYFIFIIIAGIIEMVLKSIKQLYNESFNNIWK